MIIFCRREKILEGCHSFVFRWPSGGSKMGQGQIKWNWCQWCNKWTIPKENENKIKVEIVCSVRSSMSFSRLYCSTFMLKVRVYVNRWYSVLIGWLLRKFLFHVDTSSLQKSVWDLCSPCLVANCDLQRTMWTYSNPDVYGTRKRLQVCAKKGRCLSSRKQNTEHT